MTERVDAKEFGPIVREIRMYNGLTQTDLAQAVGWKTRQRIHKLEIGEWNPTSEKARLIAEALIATQGDREKLEPWLDQQTGKA